MRAAARAIASPGFRAPRALFQRNRKHPDERKNAPMWAAPPSPTRAACTSTAFSKTRDTFEHVAARARGQPPAPCSSASMAGRGALMLTLAAKVAPERFARKRSRRRASWPCSSRWRRRAIRLRTRTASLDIAHPGRARTGARRILPRAGFPRDFPEAGGQRERAGVCESGRGRARWKSPPTRATAR